MEEVLRCPICSDSRSTPFETVEDGRRHVAYRVCRRCGHVFQSPRMSGEALELFYRADYRRLRQGEEGPTEKEILAQKARAVTLLRLTEGRIGSPLSHLDVGSSSGELLDAFRLRYRCRATGIEPGEAYREYSRGRGLETFRTLDALAAAGPARFDLVTMIHVLEHLPDPVGTLIELRTKHLQADGAVVIEVPNVDDHAALELGHLHAFHRSSLGDTLMRAGLRVAWARIHGGYRSPILRLFITMVAQPSQAPRSLRPLPFAGERTRLRRRLGTAKREFFTRRFPDWTWQSPEKALVP